jgi:DNA-binding transcriptional ArsR family regulator
MPTRALRILEAASDSSLAGHILQTFKELEKNYFLRSWKTSALDAGHFIEAVRRFIDYKLFASYPAISKPLSALNDKELKRLESATGDDSYRLHIPRALLFAYGLRNKRGIGHLSMVSANYMDASAILATCKWVLAEILRLESTLSFDETAALVDQIIERPLPGIWETGGVRRILKSDLSMRDQILFLLLYESPQTETALRASTECKNQTYFRKLLRGLHDKRLIEYAVDGLCTLSPPGYVEAEKIALR